MQQELIKEKLEKGYLHARVVLEMAGQPKEHVETTLKELVKKIQDSRAFEIIKEDFADCVEQDELWSTFVEIEMLSNSLENFTGFCFDFMPSSVEIIAPQQLLQTKDTISNFLNDLQGKLHSLDMITKRTVSENNFLKRNFNNLTRNLLAIILYNKELKLKDISSISGLPEQDLKNVLDTLVEEGKFIKKEDRYAFNISKEVESDREEQG